jgi:MFS family permease
MRFVDLLRREPRALGFGLLHTVAATIGQTFVIALFLPGIKLSFGLSDAAVSFLFTGTTLASAALLWRVGAWIDRTELVRYSLTCGVFLALSCVAVALAHHVVVLAAGMFCLRLAGNGLLTHVALTATARYFTVERGRALSLVLLGSSIGEGAFPAPMVALIANWGWRWSLAAAGALGLLLVLAAAAAVSRNAAFRNAPADAAHRSNTAATHEPARPHTPSRRYFVWSAPLFVSMPAAITAAVFHQALIAEAKEVSLQWFAVSFIAFALSRVITSVVIGPVVDRIGSDRLFTLHLLPLAAGTAALIVSDKSAIVPLYWFLAGVTSGMGTILQTTVVAEHVPLERLGSARSTLAAVTIVASAAGPSLYGLGVAAGAAITTVLWCSVAVLLAATFAGLRASRYVRVRR